MCVNACICIYRSTCVCVFVCLFTCMLMAYTFVCIHVHVYMYVHLCVNVYVCAHTCVFSWLPLFMFLCLWMHVCVLCVCADGYVGAVHKFLFSGKWEIDVKYLPPFLFTLLFWDRDSLWGRNSLLWLSWLFSRLLFSHPSHKVTVIGIL